MKHNDDGSITCEREELLNGNIKVLSFTYPLTEHQFHVLIQNGDSKADNAASKVFYVGVGVGLQLIVLLFFVCYYQLTHDKGMVDFTLTQIDKYKLGLLSICIIISGGLKIVGMLRNTERKQLISDMLSFFKK